MMHVSGSVQTARASFCRRAEPTDEAESGGAAATER